MIDEIVWHLRLADQFAENAARINEQGSKPPGWEKAIQVCITSAHRESSIALDLALKHGIEFRQVSAEHAIEQDMERRWADNMDHATLGDLLWCATTVHTSPVRSRRLSRSAERMRRVAAILTAGGVLGQLIYWTEALVRSRRRVSEAHTIRGGQLVPFHVTLL